MTRFGSLRFGLILLAILLPLWIAAQTAPPKKEGEPKVSEDSKKQGSSPKGCCRIRYEGGGYDYFPSTEEECVSKPNFHSYQKDSPLCFQSLWE